MYKMIPIFVGICKNSHIFPCKFYTIYFNRKKVGLCVWGAGGGGVGYGKKKKNNIFVLLPSRLNCNISSNFQNHSTR